VSTPTTFAYIVEHDGYLPTTSTIVVYPSSPPPLQLSMSIPSQVSTEEPFTVTVTCNNQLVKDAEVIIQGYGVLKHGFSNTEGTVDFIAPQSAHIYNITVQKEGYLSAQEILPVVEHPPITPETPLLVTTPLFVHEGELFWVTVSSEGVPVPSAQVMFAGRRTSTNVEGRAQLRSPMISNTAVYTIFATKEGYDNGSTSITVFDNSTSEPPSSVTFGWIHGQVTSSSGVVQNALVSTRTIAGNTTMNHSMTDAAGFYTVEVQDGTYTIHVSKPGYLTAVLSPVVVVANDTTEINVSLEKIPLTSDFVNSAIQWAVEYHVIGAEVLVSEDLTSQIQLYNTDVSVQVLKSPTDEQNYVLQVSGSDGTPGTVIALKITNASALLQQPISGLSDLLVTYDGEPISPAQTIDDVFLFNTNGSRPAWAAVFTEDGLTIVINIPHFSEHTIIVSSPLEKIIQTVGGPQAVVIYILLSVAFTVFIVIPIVILRRRKR
jgi:hypothetical protein